VARRRWIWKAVVWIVLVGTLVVVATELLDPAYRYRAAVRRYSAEYGLDPRLVTAMISAESSGRALSKSRKGATGLMQLMPATASEVARSFGVTRVTDELLHDPDFNIHLGTAYMKQLLRRFSSLELALAAYNAGPSRVDEWIAKNPGLSGPEIVECAAFEETRTYVHRVLDRMGAS
jgi:peptidoglycan lytic transglycosylase